MAGGRNGNAKAIMRATGADYMVANSEQIRRRELGQIKVFMMAVEATPDWIEGQPKRCVRCLAPVHGKCDR